MFFKSTIIIIVIHIALIFHLLIYEDFNLKVLYLLLRLNLHLYFFIPTKCNLNVNDSTCHLSHAHCKLNQGTIHCVPKALIVVTYILEMVSETVLLIFPEQK